MTPVVASYLSSGALARMAEQGQPMPCLFVCSPTDILEAYLSEPENVTRLAAWLMMRGDIEEAKRIISLVTGNEVLR
jgi:hypothetical protein